MVRSLAGKRVLVTGSTGFVGANLVRTILQKSPTAKIALLLRKEAKTWRIKDILKKVKVIEADITDFDSLKKVTRFKPDVIFHLATYGAYHYQSSLEDTIKTNIVGTMNLLRALESVNYKIFVNTGSSSEYGYKSKPMSESDALEPNSYYSATKGSATLLCQTYEALQKKPVVTLRLFTIYGPYEEPGRLIPTFCLNVLGEKPLSTVSTNPKRDFVYIDDVVEAYFSCVKLKTFNHTVFNICSGKQTGIKEVAKKLIKIGKSKSKIEIGKYPARPWDSAFWVGNPRLTSKVLGWKPKISLEKGLTKSLDWFRQNRELYL